MMGAKNHKTKLTEDQVRQIRESSEANKVLEERFGVSKTTICWIRSGRMWKHLPEKLWASLDAKPVARRKLDEIAVRVIRKLKVSDKALAYFYGVVQTHIYNVRQRVRWAHVI